jgi:hypothetical protein
MGGVLLLCLLAGAALASGVSVHYQLVNNFPVKYVAIEMNDPEVVVTTAVAQPFPYGLESWGGIIGRLKPDAAINGTYFCMRTYQPVGDVAVNGQLLYRGVVGTALCILPDNRVYYCPGPTFGRPDWTGCQTVLCAGPRLLTDGRVSLMARAEGFRDPHVLGSATRSVVAYREDGTLLFITIETAISLENLAYVCKNLGASQAMCLDGGTSSGLYADGRTITRPGRGVSTVLAVYGSRERYRKALGQLAPRPLPTIANLLQPDRVNRPALGWRPFVQAEEPLVMDRVVTMNTGLLHFINLNPSRVVQGVVPVTVEVGKDKRLQWTSLRIDGQLRAMTNVWPLQFSWDSTKETDGVHTLEVSAWTQERELLAKDVLQIRVQNDAKVAEAR